MEQKRKSGIGGTVRGSDGRRRKAALRGKDDLRTFREARPAPAMIDASSRGRGPALRPRHSSAHFSMLDRRSLFFSSLSASVGFHGAAGRPRPARALRMGGGDDDEDDARGSGVGSSTKSYRPGFSATNDSLHFGHFIRWPKVDSSTSILPAHSGHSIVGCSWVASQGGSWSGPIATALRPGWESFGTGVGRPATRPCDG